MFTVYFASAQSDATEVTKNATVESAMEHLGGTNTFVDFKPKEDTRGSRYLFTDWVKGSVTDISNTIYSNPEAGYNYDKISHNLYMTTNKKDVVMLDIDKIKSFSLNNIYGSSDDFIRLPALNNKAFYVAICNSKGPYSAYKLMTTHFEKANYHTDGMTETGKNYDEYVDGQEYYIGFDNGAQYKETDLTRKALNKLFADNPKAQRFFKAHKSDDVNESFLKELIEYLDN